MIMSSVPFIVHPSSQSHLVAFCQWLITLLSPISPSYLIRTQFCVAIPHYFYIFWIETASRTSQEVSDTLVLVDSGLGRCLDTWNPHGTTASCSGARFSVGLGSASSTSPAWAGGLSVYRSNFKLCSSTSQSSRKAPQGQPQKTR